MTDEKLHMEVDDELVDAIKEGRARIVSREPYVVNGKELVKMEIEWDDPRPPIKADYTREELIHICERAVLPVDKWRNRDTPGAQEKLGLAWCLLKAGCEFTINQPHPEGRHGCFTDRRTIWIVITWPSFNTFEYGLGENMNHETFYLPTPERLAESVGDDWY